MTRIRQTLIAGLLAGALLTPLPAVAQHEARLTMDSGGGSGSSDAPERVTRDSEVGPGRTDTERTRSAPSVTPSGENVGYSAPEAPKPDKPTPPKEPPAAPKATERLTEPAAKPEPARSPDPPAAESPREKRGWVDRPDGSSRQEQPAPPLPTPAPPPVASPTPADRVAAAHAAKVKAAQDAYAAVQARYANPVPRPQIQVPKKETSSNEVEVGDVVGLLIDVIKNPRDPEVWFDVLSTALAPTEIGTSSELEWVAGPYPEEVALLRAIKDLEQSLPPDERRARLNRWIEEKVWEAEHQPYIAPPRPR
jgi:hypothetical protein